MVMNEPFNHGVKKNWALLDKLAIKSAMISFPSEIDGECFKSIESRFYCQLYAETNK